MASLRDQAAVLELAAISRPASVGLGAPRRWHGAARRAALVTVILLMSLAAPRENDALNAPGSLADSMLRTGTALAAIPAAPNSLAPSAVALSGLYEAYLDPNTWHR